MHQDPDRQSMGPFEAQPRSTSSFSEGQFPARITICRMLCLLHQKSQGMRCETLVHGLSHSLDEAQKVVMVWLCLLDESMIE